MPQLHTPLCDTLGTRLPIIQAPMAGGVTTVELISAVSENGGLGSLGAAFKDVMADEPVLRAQMALFDVENLAFRAHSERFMDEWKTGKAHPAYAAMLDGRHYLGKARLFGKDYMTKYVPVKDPAGRPRPASSAARAARGASARSG